MADQDRLKTTFDSAAELYQQARPEYPEQLYAELVRLAEVCADHLDWHQSARLVHRGCPLRLALRIVC